MLIIQIALGIVLAVVIIRFWQTLLPICIVVAIVAAVLIVYAVFVGLSYAFITQPQHLPTWIAFVLPLIADFALVTIVEWCNRQKERHEK